MKIGCVILAGGKSSRMGTDKALLALKDKNFITKLCEELDDFQEKFIARGSQSELKDIAWKCIPDIYIERGPLGGIHTALLQCQSDALFCVSCDMPLLKSSLAKKLCRYFESKGKADVVIAVTEDGRKHPLCGIYRKSAVSVLEEQLLDGNYRVMEALNKLKVEYFYLSFEESVQLKNINTPEEYQTIK